MRYYRCVRPFWLYIWLLLYWYLMYCIFLLYYTLNNLSHLCQGAASPFLRILLSYHSFHQSHLTPDLSKYLSAYPLNPILIPTRVALEVPIWTARAPIRLTLESARCPCSSFVPGNVGYESLLLASCFPPVLDLITGLKQQLGGWQCWLSPHSIYNDMFP